MAKIEQTDARRKASNKYKAQFIELRLRVTPEERDKIKAYADAHGESVNGLLLRLVRAEMLKEEE